MIRHEIISMIKEAIRKAIEEGHQPEEIAFEIDKIYSESAFKPSYLHHGYEERWISSDIGKPMYRPQFKPLNVNA